MRRYQAIAAFYDPEYAHHEMLLRDVPFLMEHLSGRRSVLELACGTGRVAIPLAAAGHRVVGVDYAPDMLAIAKRKRDEAGVPARNLELIAGDITHLKLGRKFDCVCILFNTFLNFTRLKDQDALLRVALAHLKPGGFFWLDIFHPDLKLLARSASHGLDPQMFYVAEYDRTVLKTTDVERDPAEQVQKITFNYSWFDAHGHSHSKRTRFDLAFIFPRELRLLLDRNGLAIEKLYGDYNGSALNADSPRMIAKCRRLKKQVSSSAAAR